MINRLTPLRLLLIALLPLAEGNAAAAADVPLDVPVGQATVPTAPAAEHAADDARESLQASEADASRLVQGHLPELVKLLATLRSESPEQYRRAVADLARQARRLDSLRSRDVRLFEIELEILKRQTRVDLLAARLQLRDDARIRAQLRRSLTQLQQGRLARLAYDKEQAQQRLARAQQILEAAEQRLESAQQAAPAAVHQAYAGLLRRAGRSEPSAAASDQQPAKRPAAKPAADQDAADKDVGNSAGN